MQFDVNQLVPCLGPAPVQRVRHDDDGAAAGAGLHAGRAQVRQRLHAPDRHHRSTSELLALKNYEERSAGYLIFYLFSNLNYAYMHRES